MASSKIYRKISLDRLSSPEQLDQKLKIVSPIGWIAWIVLGILVASTVLWGFTGRISKKVQGNGVIIGSEGIKRVVSNSGGSVSDVSVKEGDYIEKGQTLATLNQNEMVDNINKQKEDLEYLKTLDVENGDIDYSKFNYNIYSEFINITSEIKNARTNLKVQDSEYNRNISSKNLQVSEQQLQIEQLKEQITSAQSNVKKYQDYVENMRKAAEKNPEVYANVSIPDKDYDEALISKQNEVSNLMNQLEQAEAKLKEINMQSDSYYLSSYNQINEQINNAVVQLKSLKELKIQNLEEQIEEAQENLKEASSVIADKSGVVQEVYVAKGGYIQQGGAVCTLSQDEYSSQIEQVVIYVPVDEGKKISTGMEVNLSPTTANKEEYGYILAQVVSVSEYPISQEGIMGKIGNSGIVSALTAENPALLEVVVELSRSNETVSGYKWSTPKGAPFTIDEGTICTAEIKVKTQRPADMVLPFLKKILPIS